MSLHLEFEPHSWYMGWAIKPRQRLCLNKKVWYQWQAVGLNGMTGYIQEAHGYTLKELKQQIKQRTLAERERVARLYR